MPLSSSSVPARLQNVINTTAAASNGFPVHNSGSSAEGRGHGHTTAGVFVCPQAAVLPSPTARAITGYAYPATTGIAAANAMASHATGPGGESRDEHAGAAHAFGWME